MDMTKLVILVDPGSVNMHDLMNCKELKGARILRARKAIWGNIKYHVGGSPITFFYIDDESLKDADIEGLIEKLGQFEIVEPISGISV